ncbi:MAG TPA: hypothetical protein VMN36_01530 [Verrucomicrobiales bacterium]|nr:hypothetical protein [Verrucomicrobiales bacterium]
MLLIGRPERTGGYRMPVRIEPKADPHFPGRSYAAIVELQDEVEVCSPFGRAGIGGSGRSEHKLVAESLEDREQIDRFGLAWMMADDPPEPEGPALYGSWG